MSGFYGSRGLTGISYGDRKIDRVYRGGQLLWQTLQPHTHYTEVWVGPITRSEWYTLHTHTVVGSGRANFSSSWLFNLTPIYTPTHLRAMRILRNGYQIAYWDHGGYRVMAQVWHSSGSITNQELLDGDVITLQAYASASDTNLRTLSNHGMTITPR